MILKEYWIGCVSGAAAYCGEEEAKPIPRLVIALLQMRIEWEEVRAPISTVGIVHAN